RRPHETPPALHTMPLEEQMFVRTPPSFPCDPSSSRNAVSDFGWRKLRDFSGSKSDGAAWCSDDGTGCWRSDSHGAYVALPIGHRYWTTTGADQVDSMIMSSSRSIVLWSVSWNFCRLKMKRSRL